MILWAIFHPPGERAFPVVATAMAPTLILGDTFAMTPYPSGAAPERGDVIVFRDPRDGVTIQVFRVVGLPGDNLRLEGGVIILNGAPVPREAIGEYVIDFGFELQPAEAWRETLPNSAGYDILETEPDGFLDDTTDFAVPPGHYFVLGDNRDNAADSRLVHGIGYVPADHILGRAERVLSSCKPDGRFLAGRTGLPVGPVLDGG